MDEERRSSKRFRIRLPVSLDTAPPTEELAEARTLNLGEYGAYCRLPRFVEVFTKIALSILLPREDGGFDPFSCEAVVVRIIPEVQNPAVEAYYCALYFSRMAPEERAKLCRFLKCCEDCARPWPWE
jgi:hypothetical protein